MNISAQLARHFTSWSYDDLPGEVVDRAKYLYLDFLGLAARGSTFDSSEPVLSLLHELKAGGSSPVIGTELRARPEYACLANGCFSHSLELDDVVNEASLHPAVVVFPAAMAAADLAQSGGKDFVLSAVVGYDIMIRLGRALNPSEHYRRGFHPTGTCGTFAAAASAATLLHLDENRFLNALGIAASQAAASMEFLEDGAWTKRFHPGWAAHSGLLAALLAKNGFRGTQKPVEGRYGFLHSYSDHPEPELALKDLGGAHLIMNTSIKPHACCRYNQSPIDGVLHLVRTYDLSPEEIEKVSVAMVSTALPIVAEPAEAKRKPQNMVDAQFSMPYAAATAIYRRSAFLDEYSPELIQSPEMQALMDKVECYSDPELDREFPRKWPCRVEIKTKDGQTYSKKVDHPRGDPENALSWDEIIDKFERVTANVYSPERKKEIVRQVQHLESADMKRLNELLVR